MLCVSHYHDSWRRYTDPIKLLSVHIVDRSSTLPRSLALSVLPEVSVYARSRTTPLSDIASGGSLQEKKIATSPPRFRISKLF
eukprot:gene4138-2980_t